MIKLINAKTEVRKVAYGSLKAGDAFEHHNGCIMIKTDHDGIGKGWVAAVSIESGVRYSMAPKEEVIPVVVEAKVVSRG